MPYIRLYSRSLALDQKRSIAHKLISITERVFQLHPEERGNINVQFLPPPLPGELAPLGPPNESADVFVEVSDRYLTAAKAAAFAEASAPMLSGAVLSSQSRRLARMLGLEADLALQVAFQFKASGADYRNSLASSTVALPERKAA